MSGFDMRFSDWSSDVCSSDLRVEIGLAQAGDAVAVQPDQEVLAPDVLFGQVSPEPAVIASITIVAHDEIVPGRNLHRALLPLVDERQPVDLQDLVLVPGDLLGQQAGPGHLGAAARSEEHTSELQSLMRTSYAVFCLKQTNYTIK